MQTRVSKGLAVVFALAACPDPNSPSPPREGEGDEGESDGEGESATRWCDFDFGGCFAELNSDEEIDAFVRATDLPDAFDSLIFHGPDVTTLSAMADLDITLTSLLEVSVTSLTEIVNLPRLVQQPDHGIEVFIDSNPQLETVLFESLVDLTVVGVVDNPMLTELRFPNAETILGAENERNPHLCNIDIGTAASVDACSSLNQPCEGTLEFRSGCD